MRDLGLPIGVLLRLDKQLHRKIGTQMYSSLKSKGCIIFVSAAALAVASHSAFSEVRLASWNVLHGGWNPPKAMKQVAHVANHFDFLALQEVMDEDFVNRLEGRLEDASGESWSSMASHTVGRSSYQEMYAFLYRDSAVEYDSGAVVYLDPGDLFAREPYSAQFIERDSGHRFAVGTVHVVFGDSVADRLPELDALADYWGWLDETYPEATTLLVGDFNMPPSHDGWDNLRDTGATPLITDGASTLGTQEGEWSSLYDNIWIDDSELEVTDSGILAYPDLVPLSHVDSRSRISDHAPVYVGLDGGEVTPTTFDGKPMKNPSTKTCIDLNESSARELERLPRIGEARAGDLVEGRPWASVGALTSIKGVGPATVEGIASSGLLCN